jgi:hypothetical protein
MTLNEVADLITSPEAERLACGNYMNKRGVRGYYLQVKCGDQWCKVSVSHADRHSNRITADELHEIDQSKLQPSVVIPTDSISTALKSAAAERASIQKYTNSSAVEGIWAEFYHNGHWYMISVSRIDSPVGARQELDTIADEFLWQQGHGRRWPKPPWK